MDPLEEQLVKLSALNRLVNLPKSDNSCKVSELDSSLQENICHEGNPIATCESDDIPETSCSKKVGPQVPPKPQKKKHNLPEVPQSSLVMKTCEPLFSKRLESLDGQNSPNISTNNIKLTILNSEPRVAPILQRKQPIYAAQNSLYDKTSKLTLDNPDILEQQLEALAHHKKQLEKMRSHLQQEQPHAKINTKAKSKSPTLNVSGIPKLSSTSLLNDGRGREYVNTMYSNIKQLSIAPASGDNTHMSVLKNRNVDNVVNSKDSDKVELSQQDILDDTSGRHNIYYNVSYKKDIALDELSLPQSHLKSLAETTDEVRTAIGYDDGINLHEDRDDDIPPPPSPVSSSYSELRRATDIFSKKLNPTDQAQFNTLANEDIEHYSNFEDAKSTRSTTTKGNETAGNSQTYTNMNFNNEYASYNSTLQYEFWGSGNRGINLISFRDNYSNVHKSTHPFQGSSTYESIYEPINPRPPSQLSGRSNFFMYASYVNSQQKDARESSGGSGDITNINLPPNDVKSSSYHTSGIGPNCANGVKVLPEKDLSDNYQRQQEAEVKALTNFLVHSMDTVNDGDSYGICYSCNERVLGENSGCTAMDQIYHISCFTCSQCQINLQGKPFYALEGKPFCEYDYLQTLEKCSVCMNPILERILRATGKPYHPQCFTCIVCSRSLDGIPFTVDATNQNYCIADFHKKFAPRCCVCKEPIMPEPGEEETVRVVALDRSFHFECYKCEDCGLLLSSEAEGRGCYPLDDHVLCKSCNAKRVQLLTNRMTTEL